jgi:hypothetical protein
MLLWTSFSFGEQFPVGLTLAVLVQPGAAHAGFSPPLIEPAIKRAVVFVGGQNLFNAAKEAFGYHFPNSTSSVSLKLSVDTKIGI